MVKTTRRGGMGRSGQVDGGYGGGQGGRPGQGNSNRRLNTRNSAMTPSPGMEHPGRSRYSVSLPARSSTPTSILNGGKQTFGPLSYSDQEYNKPRRK